MNTNQILHSGDLELIVRNLSRDNILEHFGEDSFEYLALEHYEADKIWKKRQRKNYIIPRRTEDPSVTYGMLKNWIREFAEKNNLPLPKGFHKRDKEQLRGMYRGMLKYYDIRLTDIVPHYI